MYLIYLFEITPNRRRKFVRLIALREEKTCRLYCNIYNLTVTNYVYAVLSIDVLDMSK